jgi:hypothetical protein
VVKDLLFEIQDSLCIHEFNCIAYFCTLGCLMRSSIITVSHVELCSVVVEKSHRKVVLFWLIFGIFGMRAFFAPACMVRLLR